MSSRTKITLHYNLEEAKEVRTVPAKKSAFRKIQKKKRHRSHHELRCFNVPNNNPFHQYETVPSPTFEHQLMTNTFIPKLILLFTFAVLPRVSSFDSCLFRVQPCVRPAFLSSIPSKKRHSTSQLHGSLIKTAAATANSFWKSQPYTAAAVVCGIKASAADFVAQRRNYRKRVATDEEVDTETSKFSIQRNLAYIFYGSIYQGLAQEYIYNHIYPVLFGAGTNFATVLSKVMFDMLLQTPLVTLPIAYMSKAVIYRYSFREAFHQYINDIRNQKLLAKYWMLWAPVMSITFSIVPEHYRVTFVAMVSFFWLIILSSIANKAPDV